MGAYLKLRERLIERRLSAEATRGVVAPAATPNASVTAPSDMRADIPRLGLREYWYPALPVRRLSKRRPLYLVDRTINLDAAEPATRRPRLFGSRRRKAGV